MRLTARYMLLSSGAKNPAEAHGIPGPGPGVAYNNGPVAMSGWLTTPVDCRTIPVGPVRGGLPYSGIIARDGKGNRYELLYGVAAPNLCWFAFPFGYSGYPADMRIVGYVDGKLRNEVRLPPFPAARNLLPKSAATPSPDFEAIATGSVLTIHALGRWGRGHDLDIRLVKTSHQTHYRSATMWRTRTPTVADENKDAVRFQIPYARYAEVAEIEASAIEWSTATTIVRFGLRRTADGWQIQSRSRAPNGSGVGIALRSLRSMDRSNLIFDDEKLRMALVMLQPGRASIESVELGATKPEDLEASTIQVVLPKEVEDRSAERRIVGFQARSSLRRQPIGTVRTLEFVVRTIARTEVEQKRYILPVRHVER